MRLAPEGRPFIGAAWLILLALLGPAALWGGWYFVPLAVWLPIALWVPYFFRDPDRTGPRERDIVICPADGVVVSVQECTVDEYLEGPALRISVFMNVFNVHVNRYPVGGKVELLRYRPGAFLNATLDKASELNERMSVGIASPGGKVLIRQIAGLVARRIVTYSQLGHEADQGDRMGMIRFGSRVDTFLPTRCQPRVREGDRVRAGETVIAAWKDMTDES